MATTTQKLAGFDNDTVVFEAIITTTDFLTGNVTGFRAVADATAVGSAYGEIFLPNGTKKQASTCLAGTDTTVSLSGTSRLAVTFDSRRQRWVGIRGNFIGPAHPVAALAVGAESAQAAPQRVTFQ